MLRACVSRYPHNGKLDFMFCICGITFAVVSAKYHDEPSAYCVSIKHVAAHPCKVMNVVCMCDIGIIAYLISASLSCIRYIILLRNQLQPVLHIIATRAF